MKTENPPFPRGETQDASNDSLDHLLGREWTFEDHVLSGTTRNQTRTNRAVTCRLVKNDSGAALLPKRLVRFSTDAGEYGSVVDGYTASTAERGYPVDEWLPAAGVPNDHYFWVVVGGPAVVLAPLSGAEFGSAVSVGSVLVGLTAVTSGATTAGRVAVASTTASNDIAMNYIGRALTAKTTGNTGAEILADLGKY